MADVTQWLNSSGQGPQDAQFEELYLELKKIARSRMNGERAGHTLQATALAHEAWIRLENSASEVWRDRTQYYAAAAEAMRRILVESARRRLTKKRGGGETTVPLDDDEVSIAGVLSDERLLEVHEVLDQLAEVNEMDAQVVKLRYFGGMKVTEIAALHATSKRTVQRHLLAAKAWLYENLNGG